MFGLRNTWIHRCIFGIAGVLYLCSSTCTPVPLCLSDRDCLPQRCVQQRCVASPQASGEVSVEQSGASDGGHEPSRPELLLEQASSRDALASDLPPRDLPEPDGGRPTPELPSLACPKIQIALSRKEIQAHPSVVKVRVVLELVTVVPPPHRLTHPQLTTPPGFQINELQESGSAVCTSRGCKQRFYVVLVPDAEICRLDGRYTFRFVVACEPSPGCQCRSRVERVLFLDSEDFC